LIAARTVIPRGAARTSRYRDGRATTGACRHATEKLRA